MKSQGYNVNADTLDRKIRNMKNTYRTILDNNKKKSTGRNRISWEYFNIFEEIFQEDKPVSNTPTISSIVISGNEDDEPAPVEVNNSEPEGNDGGLTDKSRSSTPSLKQVKAKHLDTFRKRQLEVEESKLAEMKKLRETIEESNQIQKEKVALLRELVKQKWNEHI